MTKIEGDEATALVDDANRHSVELIERGKADAAAQGRDPFDLAKLEQLCNTMRDGVLDPEPDRRKHFEHLYYVQHPELQTMEELAQYIDSSGRW